MFFANLKLWFQKAGLWLKAHWVWLVFLVSSIIAIVFIKNGADRYKKLWLDYKTQANDYKQQLTALEKSHEEETRRKAVIEQNYQETLVRIQEENLALHIALDKAKKQEIRAIVEENHDDPDKMAARVNVLLGIPVEKNGCS